MDRREIEALIQLLNRTPMTLPERMWVNGVVARMLAEAAEREKAEVEENVAIESS